MKQPLVSASAEDQPEKELVSDLEVKDKALHSELLTELSSRFLSRNKFFAISKV